MPDSSLYTSLLAVALRDRFAVKAKLDPEDCSCESVEVSEPRMTQRLLFIIRERQPKQRDSWPSRLNVRLYGDNHIFQRVTTGVAEEYIHL